MKKSKLLQSKNHCFLLALLLSVMLPAGIVMIVMGFSKSMLFIGIPGIIFTVLGFYGTPIAWLRYARFRHLHSLYLRITEDKLYSILLLAQSSGHKGKSVAADVQYLINNRYLAGYILADDKIVNVAQTADPTLTGKKAMGKIVTVKCPACGALANIEDGRGECPYCGRNINSSNCN